MSQNTRGSVRQPWLVPVLVAAVALGLFLAVALTRGGLAGETLVVHFLVNGAVFVALAVAALSGFVRGFSGFGSALIYIPLIAAIYEPRIAAPTLLLIDLAGSVPFTIRELKRCNWREVGPVTGAAALAVPLGTMALILIDPIVLRWFIAVLVLGLLRTRWLR